MANFSAAILLRCWVVPESLCRCKQAVFCEVRPKKFRVDLFSGEDVHDAIEGEIDFENFLGEETIDGANEVMDNGWGFVQCELECDRS